MEWEKSYGTGDFGVLHFAQQTSDGGYFIGGSTSPLNQPDFWLLKLDSSGNVEWEKRYGGDIDEIVNSGVQTSNDGYIVAGSNRSFGSGNSDVLVLRLDSDGNIEWEKTYGGAGFDFPNSIRQTTEGAYIVAATTTSFGAGFLIFFCQD